MLIIIIFVLNINNLKELFINKIFNFDEFITDNTGNTILHYIYSNHRLELVDLFKKHEYINNDFLTPFECYYKLPPILSNLI